MKAGHTNWTLVNSKNCFGELITRALPEGPRRVRQRDDVVVVLSKAEYQRLSGKRVRLKDAILHGPDMSDLDLERDPNPIRETRW
jgi:hypothetical protein